MRQVEVKKDIFWVGAIDWNLRHFHGYLTQKGSTYNAYLVLDEKITLIDTTKVTLVDELIARVKALVDPSKIDYIVANHVEMDHSGGLVKLMTLCPNATIVTSMKGKLGLERHFKQNWNYQVIKSGDVLNLGKRNLNFVLTPMVHWPDNMVSYMPEEKILFSNDGMGQHLATSERFDDEYPLNVTLEEAKKYYANIVLPYGTQVNMELKTAATLDIEMICPSHGLIWRSHIDKIVECYQAWANHVVKKKAVIVYDTMWESTTKMANAIYEAFDEKGYEVKKCFLQSDHISDVMTNVMDAEYIAIGSPILNKNILPTVAAFHTYLRGLAPKARKYFVFGSFGWAAGALDDLSADIAKFGEVKSTIKMNFVPDESELIQLREDIKALV